jgi:hypothetical protein
MKSLLPLFLFTFLTSVFYKLKEPLMDLQVAFIRKNKEAFIEK